MPWKEWALASEVARRAQQSRNRPKPHIARAHSLLKEETGSAEKLCGGFHDWIKEKI